MNSKLHQYPGRLSLARPSTEAISSRPCCAHFSFSFFWPLSSAAGFVSEVVGSEPSSPLREGLVRERSSSYSLLPLGEGLGMRVRSLGRSLLDHFVVFTRAQRKVKKGSRSSPHPNPLPKGEGVSRQLDPVESSRLGLSKKEH